MPDRDTALLSTLVGRAGEADGLLREWLAWHAGQEFDDCQLTRRTRALLARRITEEETHG